MDEPADPTALEGAARAANERFVAAIRGHDPSAASAEYAPNARLVAPSADLIEGRAGIESFWRAGLDAGIRDVARFPVRIEAHGSIAFEIGQYAIRLRPPDGGCVVDRGSYLLVHERSAAGTWAWTLEMFTPEGTPQVASAPPPLEREVIEGT
jgi:ketosteroid isomerase-like protein